MGRAKEGELMKPVTMLILAAALFGVGYVVVKFQEKKKIDTGGNREPTADRAPIPGYIIGWAERRKVNS